MSHIKSFSKLVVSAADKVSAVTRRDALAEYTIIY